MHTNASMGLLLLIPDEVAHFLNYGVFLKAWARQAKSSRLEGHSEIPLRSCTQ